MALKQTTIDIEPKWIDLITYWSETKQLKCNSYILGELKKIATATDTVRQAQKEGKKYLKL